MQIKRRKLTSIVAKIGVLIIHHGLSSIMSQQPDSFRQALVMTHDEIKIVGAPQPIRMYHQKYFLSEKKETANSAWR